MAQQPEDARHGDSRHGSRHGDSRHGAGQQALRRQDEVDDVIAGWSAARPDLDLAPMQLLSRVHRLAQVLSEQREQAFAEHGLAAHEFDVLAALRRAARPLTPGDLVAATHVTSGTMTHRVARLLDRRLVSRRADPEDGRQWLLSLTAAGRRRVDGAIDSLLAAEAAVVAGLPAGELSVTVGALRRLLVDAEAAGKLASG